VRAVEVRRLVRQSIAWMAAAMASSAALTKEAGARVGNGAACN